MQKRARNLAAEELSIEVISGREGNNFSVIKELNFPFTDVINIKSTFGEMMFGRGSAFPLPSTYKRTSSRSSREDYLNSLWFYSRSSCSNNRKQKTFRLMKLRLKSPDQNENVSLL